MEIYLPMPFSKRPLLFQAPHDDYHNFGSAALVDALHGFFMLRSLPFTETYNPYKTETSLMSLEKNMLDTDFPTPIKEMLQENDNDKLHYLMGRQILEAHHETEPGSESIKDEFVETTATLVTKAFTAFDICPLDKYI